MFLLFPSLTLDPNCVVGKCQDSERESIPPNIGNISVGVVVVTSQRAPSSSPFLCKIQIIPPPLPDSSCAWFFKSVFNVAKGTIK